MAVIFALYLITAQNGNIMQVAEAIAFFVINALEAVVIITGNTFTIFVFWTHRTHLKRAWFLLINLAVADLLVGITEPIILGTEKIPTDKGPPREHKRLTGPSSAIQILGSSVSVFFLALISLERVFAVLWPLRHRVVSNRVYVYSILVVWAVGICFALLHLLPVQINMKWVTVALNSCLFVSLLIMCSSYIEIRTRLRSETPELEVHDRNSRELNLRLSRTVFIVIALSIVFWLPAFVAYTILVCCKSCFPPNMVPIVKAFHLANSMVNPLVYTFRMPIFKDAFKKTLCKRRSIQIRPVQVCGLHLGRRGSFTPQMDHTVNRPGLTSV